MYKYKAALNPPTPFHFLHEREESQIVVLPIFLAARSVHWIHFWGTKYKRQNLVGALGRFGWLSYSKEDCYQPHVGHTFPSSCFTLGHHLCKSSADPTTTRKGEDNQMAGPSPDMSAQLKTCQQLPSPGFFLGWRIEGGVVLSLFTQSRNIPIMPSLPPPNPWSSQNSVKQVKDNKNSIIRQYRHVSLLTGSVQMGSLNQRIHLSPPCSYAGGLVFLLDWVPCWHTLQSYTGCSFHLTICYKKEHVFPTALAFPLVMIFHLPRVLPIYPLFCITACWSLGIILSATISLIWSLLSYWKILLSCDINIIHFIIFLCTNSIPCPCKITLLLPLDHKAHWGRGEFGIQGICVVPRPESTDVGVTASSTNLSRVDFSIKSGSLHHTLPDCSILGKNDGQRRTVAGGWGVG